MRKLMVLISLVLSARLPLLQQWGQPKKNNVTELVFSHPKMGTPACYFLIRQYIDAGGTFRSMFII